jgi:hypothetical protein
MAAPIAHAFAQVVISSGMSLNAANNPILTLHTASNLSNNSSYTFGNTDLTVVLNGSTQNIGGNWQIANLLFDGAGIKTITGALTVTTRIVFERGIAKPTQAAHFLYNAGTDVIEVRNDDSYVDGIFYQQGTGLRLFPTGTATAYAPFTLENCQTTQEVGAQAYDDDPALTAGDPGVGTIEKQRYWQVQAGEIADIRSRVTVGLNGTLQGSSQLVVQADKVGGSASSLGSLHATAQSITSELVITAPVITIASANEGGKVKIHEAISPFGSPGVNDKLVIENITTYDRKKVSLLDRWGGIVKTWEDAEVTDEIDYDFSRLAPDSYICIVEYHNIGQSIKKLSQFVVIVPSE